MFATTDSKNSKLIGYDKVTNHVHIFKEHLVIQFLLNQIGSF